MWIFIKFVFYPNVEIYKIISFIKTWIYIKLYFYPNVKFYKIIFIFFLILIFESNVDFYQIIFFYPNMDFYKIIFLT